MKLPHQPVRRSIMSLPATSSLRSRRQRCSDLQEDSNSESGTGSDDDQGTNSSHGSQTGSQTSSQDGTGTNSDTDTGVSGNISMAGDSHSVEAMTIDDKGTSSDSDDDNKKINSSPRPHLACRKTVGPTANDTPTVATAMTAAEETGPTVSLAATGNGTIMSTATSQTNTTSICNPTMSIVTAIAPLAPVDNVQIIHSTVGMATSDSHPGGTLSTLKGPAPDSVSTALDQSDAAPTTPPGPGAVPVQGTLFYFILWM